MSTFRRYTECEPPVYDVNELLQSASENRNCRFSKGKKNCKTVRERKTKNVPADEALKRSHSVM